jgi:predicted RNA binding protein YcfA (HicA-like mRNA interferase family)
MSKPRFKFSSLRRLLLELGFKKVPLKGAFIGFEHKESDTLIVLPGYYRSNSWVHVHHLVYVRVTLDAKGLMEADDFERLVIMSEAQHSASS